MKKNDEKTTEKHESPLQLTNYKIIPKKSYYSSANQIEKIAEEYFNYCDQMKKPYTITGLAYALGFKTREALWRYEQKSVLSNAIKRAKLRIQQQLETKLLTPGQPTIGIIFNLKNNFGWKDATEVKQSGSVELRIIAMPARKAEGSPVDMTAKIENEELKENAEKRIKKLPKRQNVSLMKLNSA